MFLRLFISLFNICIFVVFFPANLAVIWVICKSLGLRKLWSYRIIANIAVADSLMLVNVLLAGLMSLFNREFPNFVLKVSWNLLDVGIDLLQIIVMMHLCLTMTELLLCFTLTANRLFVILQLSRFDKAFIYRGMLVISWSLGVLGAVSALFDSKLYYDLKVHLFRTDAAGFFHRSRVYTFPALFALSALMHGIIVLKLSFQRKKVASEDIKLFIQAVLPFTWLVLYMFLSNRSSWINNPLLAQLSLHCVHGFQWVDSAEGNHEADGVEEEQSEGGDCYGYHVEITILTATIACDEVEE
uniref:G_PROTEIN_RECEP_F1_2 domain-containing protein n=1 Tax=Steinernema glaseri TaxID=37863 RepID=A0A1I7Z9Z4_9BILA